MAVQPNPGVMGSIAVTAGVVFAWLYGCWCCPLLSAPSLLPTGTLLCLLIQIAALTTSLYLIQSVATASQPAELMLPAFRSHLQMSLKQRTGLPAGMEPVASSLYSRSLGIQPSCMWLTWPNQCKCLWVSKAKHVWYSCLSQDIVVWGHGLARWCPKSF